MKNVVSGQIDLWSICEEVAEFLNISKPDEEVKEPVDYLKRSDYVKNLVRQKKSRDVAEFKENCMHECITSNAYKKWLESPEYGDGYESILECIAKYVVDPKLKELVGNEEQASSLLDMLAPLDTRILKRFTLTEATASERADANIIGKKEALEVIRIASTKPGDHTGRFPYELLVFGDKVSKRMKNSAFWIRSGGYKHYTPRYREARTFIAGLYMLDYVLREMDRVKAIPYQERAEDNLYDYIHRESIFSRYVDGVEVVTPRKVCVEEEVEFLDFFNVPYEYIKDEDSRVRYASLYKVFANTFEYANLHSYTFLRAVTNAFMQCHEFYLDDKREYELSKERSGSYALSFETKSNIPQSHLKAMEESGFNDYFGYVEFDELCDLKKIEELEEEFKALSSAFFNGTKFSDVSLRFRRLGNHKASGLYYPAFKCICIDIRMPSSFIHEFFHMLDHEGAESGSDYSRRASFKKISSAYKTAFTKALGDTKLKGKYNMSYYLAPSEIFARCAEMYFTRVLDVKNSLCQPVGGFAYPEDECLDRLVKEYFDNFLLGQFGFERIEKEVCA